MPNYEQPEFVEQRVRYFEGQALVDQDYIDDQKYHIDRVRRLGRVLTVAGIGEGLTVTAAPFLATVQPGTAFDARGRQIVLAQPEAVALSDLSGKTVTLVISYNEVEASPTKGPGGIRVNKRWQEKPKVEAIPDGQAIPPDSVKLAQLTIADDGNFNIDDQALSVREYSGISLPSHTDNQATLRAAGSGNPSDLAVLSGSLQITQGLSVTGNLAGSTATLSGDLTVTGKATTGNATVNGDLSVTGKVTAASATVTGAVEMNSNLAIAGNINFGNQTRQMLTLWNPDYGIGIQSSTQYFRTAKNFAWYKGGAHNDAELDSGNGTAQMVIKDGNVGIGRSDPSSALHVAVDRSIRFELGSNQKLSLGGNGTLEVDAPNIVGGRFIVTNDGKVGISTTTPNAKLEVKLASATADASLKLEHIGSNVIVRPLTAGGTSSVIENTGGGSLVINPNGGNVSIGTPVPGKKLTVAAASEHLQLIRSKTETTGGKQVFLELFQEDDASLKVPEVFASIRFHHAGRYWHRIEARSDGLHFKTGDPNSDAYARIFAENMIVTGMIIMWFGDVNNIPSGWVLCDGKPGTGTPNLTDRFVVGAGGKYKPNANGGADRVTLTVDQMPSHNHDASSGGAGNHAHEMLFDTGGGGFTGGARMAKTPEGLQQNVLANYSAPTQAVGDHTHAISVGFRGGNQSHENMPPFWALVFIMKQ